MSDPVRCSDFVQRCQDTMAEYERLRFLGIGHDIAGDVIGCLNCFSQEHIVKKSSNSGGLHRLEADRR